MKPARQADLLDAADLQALPLLDHPDELGGLHQRVERAGVQPGGAAVQHGRRAARRGCRYASLTAVISSSPRALGLEVAGRSRPPGCRRSTGPAPRSGTSAGPASPRSTAPCRRRRTRPRRTPAGWPPGRRRPARPRARCCRRSCRPRPHAVEDVVAEDQRDRVVADEVRADDERLGDALRAWSAPRTRSRRPHWLPSPSSRWNWAWSSGVVITRISRIPAITSVVSG